MKFPKPTPVIGSLSSLPLRERGLKYRARAIQIKRLSVAPLAGAWIEMNMTRSLFIQWIVAPLAGAWIEIATIKPIRLLRMVAPLAGAWIEISRLNFVFQSQKVAPLAGAWIEIIPSLLMKRITVSLPLRERGLKSTGEPVV